MAWKMVFLAVFVLLSNLALAPHFTDDTRLGTDPSIPIVSIWGYLLGGFFVGFGTRMGNGCTTGHGICGMARLSVRSISAVCTFMLSAICTALIVAPGNQVFANGTAWLRTDQVPKLYHQWLGLGVSMILVLPALYALYNLFFRNKNNDEPENEKDVEAVATSSHEKPAPAYGAFDKSETEVGSESSKNDDSSHDPVQEHQDNVRKLYSSVLASMLFATGLAVSGMVLPSKISGFLNFFLIPEGTYDPTLLTVMIGGCIVSMISYQFVKSFSLIFSEDNTSPLALRKPLLVSKFSIPCSCIIDVELIGGAFCFGIGWGLANLCPGPAMFLFASGTKPVIIGWWPAFLAGSFLAQWIKSRREATGSPQ
jgi:uncharacterized membrane protein YedE/YeeE